MAADDQNTELLPILDSDDPFFDVGLRGYDKRQVDDYVARAVAQIAELTAARDAALALSAERAALLASQQGQIEALNQRVANSNRPPDPATVSDRIREMLQLATEEATQTRHAAELEAERVLAAARADAERIRNEAVAEQQRLTTTAAQRSAEVDQQLAQVRTQVEQLLAEARFKREQLDAESLAARTAAEQESARRIRTAEEDFEITLRQRRTAAQREDAARRAAAEAEARQLVDDAHQRAAELATERERTHQALRELHARLGTVLGDIVDSPAVPPSGKR
ncbi:MAG TPA: hypothetical protein VJ851_12445 [Jatrophihabitans sp.]|nr:hypothetical protein [Jatrophihabitans sp.]